MTERLAADADGIARAAELIQAGEVVAFPTETVYGLGADATNSAAVRKVFEAKGRPATNPLIVHVTGSAQACQFAGEWSDRAEELAEAFWPGALTIIVPAGDSICREALAGGSTVGLRAPELPLALQFIEACGRPLAAPSANRSGSLSPVKAEHVLADLDGRIAAVLDGGACNVGIESTVIDITVEPPRILRPGSVGAMQIEGILCCDIDASFMVANDSETMKAPGMFSKHYAPRVPLRLVTRDELLAADDSVARVFIDSVPTGIQGVAIPSAPRLFAQQIYSLLWELQSGGWKAIHLESPPDDLKWAAVLDRLRRASSE